MNKKYSADNLKDIQKLANLSREIAKKIETGKEYPLTYVVARFEKAAYNRSTDQLINNMRDVLIKVANKKEFISQTEIGSIYDRMMGFGGSNSFFRNDLGDLLPPNRQFSEKVASESQLRVDSENEMAPIHSDSDLSRALGKILDVNTTSSFSTFNSLKNDSILKVTLAALNSIGCTPQSLAVSSRNEHYALCTALFSSKAFDKVAVHIPVQITEGQFSSPENFIAEDVLVPLTKENMFLHMKNEEHMKKASRQAKIITARDDMGAPIQQDKVNIPDELKDYAEMEGALIAASAKYSQNHVRLATSVIEAELKSFGAVQPSIKVHAATDKELVFNVKLNTTYGNRIISVPIEFHNNSPLMPSKFYSNASSDSGTQYKFSGDGFEKFIRNAEGETPEAKMLRDTHEYEYMSLPQLMDQVLTGVSEKRYHIASDAIRVIQNKFGDEQFKIALDKYSKMLKHVSSDGNKGREQMVEAALKRGDLIKRANYSELFCPKLGLPLSKVAFDSEGRVTPIHRAKAKEQAQDVTAITSESGLIVLK